MAFYTATLPSHDQVTLYAEFLQDISQSNLRRAALEAAESAHLPVEAITQRVVENIRSVTCYGKHWPAPTQAQSPHSYIFTAAFDVAFINTFYNY